MAKTSIRFSLHRSTHTKEMTYMEYLGFYNFITVYNESHFCQPIADLTEFVRNNYKNLNQIPLYICTDINNPSYDAWQDSYGSDKHQEYEITTSNNIIHRSITLDYLLGIQYAADLLRVSVLNYFKNLKSSNEGLYPLPLLE